MSEEPTESPGPPGSPERAEQSARGRGSSRPDEASPLIEAKPLPDPMAGDTVPLERLESFDVLGLPQPGEQAAAEVPKRKRRWWVGALGALLVIGVLSGASEIALRLIIPNVIATAVREKLDLTSDHPVDVSLGGSALLHTLTGEVGQVSVSVDDAELVEGLRGAVALHADAVPFDILHGDIEGGSATLTLNREQLPAAISLLTSGIADDGQVSGGELVVSRTMELFGAQVPLSVHLALAVKNGDVTVEPRSIEAVGFDLTTDQIRAAVGGSLAGLLDAHQVCVRDRLPRGIVLEKIELSSTGDVRLGVALAPGIVSDPAERAPGRCP